MKFRPQKSNQNTPNLKPFLIVVILLSSTIATTFSFSETTYAGLFSFVSALIGSQDASARIETPVSTQNSQTIALLQAAVNSDPNPNKATGEMPIMNNILMADLAVASGGDGESGTQISVYTVRDGDSLSGIADMFDVSINTILWANDLKRTSSLKVGQTLVILPVTGITYTIKKGDTITGIVTKYKADLDEVLSYNDITLKSTLVPGDSIIIPDAEIPTVVPTRVVAGKGATDSGGPNYSGYYIRPLKTGIKTQGIHGHNGIDIGAPVGTPIYASAAGTVILSLSGGWNGGYGSYVIISHKNGTQTVYAHTSKNFVTNGQSVEQGEQIALVGATGKATGPHIHFEIRGAKNPF